MSSSTPSLQDLYDVFQSHLLGSVLGLPWDSPAVKTLVDSVGVKLLNDFLLFPPSYYEDELTYIEVREDGSTALMALHPTYMALLMAFFKWCCLFIGGNCIPPTPAASGLLGLISSIS